MCNNCILYSRMASRPSFLPSQVTSKTATSPYPAKQHVSCLSAWHDHPRPLILSYYFHTLLSTMAVHIPVSRPKACFVTACGYPNLESTLFALSWYLRSVATCMYTLRSTMHERYRTEWSACLEDLHMTHTVTAYRFYIMKVHWQLVPTFSWEMATATIIARW